MYQTLTASPPFTTIDWTVVVVLIVSVTTYNPGNVELEYNQGAQSGTPEPASFWLTLAVLGSCLAWKRRKWVTL